MRTEEPQLNELIADLLQLLDTAVNRLGVTLYQGLNALATELVRRLVEYMESPAGQQLVADLERFQPREPRANLAAELYEDVQMQLRDNLMRPHRD